MKYTIDEGLLHALVRRENLPPSTNANYLINICLFMHMDESRNNNPIG